MAAFSPTPANVDTSAAHKATAVDVVCGETLAAGDLVYKDTDDSNKMKLAVNSSITAAKVAGVMLTGGADGQPGKMQKVGELDMGGTLVVGTVYVLSSTAGDMEPYGDLSAADYVTIIGVAKTASNFKLSIIPSGVVVPA